MTPSSGRHPNGVPAPSLPPQPKNSLTHTHMQYQQLQSQSQSQHSSSAVRPHPNWRNRPHPLASIPIPPSSSAPPPDSSGFLPYSSPFPFHQQPNQTGDFDAKIRGNATIKWDNAATINIANCKTSVCGDAIIKGGSDQVSTDLSLGLASTTCGKHKKSRKTKPGPQKSNAGNLDSLNLATNCRYDSSLGLLTKKFISLIQEAPGGTLDLNNTADVLEVQKRRVYDITNVLEGVNLIEKTSKNHIRWKGFETLTPREIIDQFCELKAEILSLYAEEARLDYCIRQKQEHVRVLECDEKYRKYLFLTEEDFKSLPFFKDQTLIAINAPYASSVKVPDPDEDIDFPQRQYRLLVRSTTGPINVYLLSKNEGQREDVAVKRTKTLDISAHNESIYGVDAADLSPDHQNDQEMSIASNGKADSNVPGIQKILPSDFDIADDYWFWSDHEYSATDLWGIE